MLFYSPILLYNRLTGIHSSDLVREDTTLNMSTHLKDNAFRSLFTQRLTHLSKCVVAVV